MRKCEFKIRYDPDKGRYVRRHIYDERQIYGEGIMDVVRSITSRVLGKTMKNIASKAVSKAASTASEKTGQHLGNMAGDKIIQLLSRGKKTYYPSINNQPITKPTTNQI